MPNRLLTPIEYIGYGNHEQSEHPLYLQVDFLCSPSNRRLHLNIGYLLANEPQRKAEGSQARAGQGDQVRERRQQGPHQCHYYSIEIQSIYFIISD